MNIRRCIAALAIPALAASGALVGTAATASEAPSAPAGDYVIVGAHEKEPLASSSISSSDASDDTEEAFYPTGEIGPDTLVVIANPDGSLPGGITESELSTMLAERAVGSSETARSLGLIVPDDQLAGEVNARSADGEMSIMGTHRYGARSATSWGPMYTGDAIFGTPGYRLTYNFGADRTQTNAGNGRGYFTGYNGSEFGVFERYYNLGSAGGQSGVRGGATVEWGNVLADTKFRAKCATSTVCGGDFSP